MKKFTFKGVLDGFRSSVQAAPRGTEQEIQETLRTDHFQIKKVSPRLSEAVVGTARWWWRIYSAPRSASRARPAGTTPARTTNQNIGVYDRLADSLSCIPLQTCGRIRLISKAINSHCSFCHLTSACPWPCRPLLVSAVHM